MKNLIMNNKAILIAAALLASLSGCAVIPEQASLEYNGQQNVVQIPEASKVFVAVQVNDNRNDKNVGNLKNGYGMKMASITATQDVSVTVRQAIEHELQSRGFRLGPDATVIITADINRFYNDFTVRFASGRATADLNMNVIVKSKKGDLLYSKQLSSDGVKELGMFDTFTQKNAKITLDKALANAMQTLFDDKAFIAALMASTTSN